MAPGYSMHLPSSSSFTRTILYVDLLLLRKSLSLIVIGFLSRSLVLCFGLVAGFDNNDITQTSFIVAPIHFPHSKVI